MREHKTGYARIVETAEGSNEYNVYIGKQGGNGKPTYFVVMGDNGVFGTVDLRHEDSESTSFLPKVLSADGKTKDTESETPKIVQSLLDQLARKFLKPAGAAKPKKKAKAAKAKPKAKAKKAAPKKAAKKAEAVELPEVAAEDMEPVVAEKLKKGEKDTHVIVLGRKFAKEVNKRDGMITVKVSRGKESGLTTIIDEADIDATITKLACNLIHEPVPSDQ